MSISSNDCFCLLYASPAKMDDRPHLESEVRKAHVICIVYAIDDPHSFSRIPNYWLPWLRAIGVNVPLILVGNKIDLRTSFPRPPQSKNRHGAQSHHPQNHPHRISLTNQSLEEEIAPIMTEFKEVETCVESSAKLPLNISEVFYFAQKAVLHPTAPLYDSREHVSLLWFIFALLISSGSQTCLRSCVTTNLQAL